MRAQPANRGAGPRPTLPLNRAPKSLGRELSLPWRLEPAGREVLGEPCSALPHRCETGPETQRDPSKVMQLGGEVKPSEPPSGLTLSTWPLVCNRLRVGPRA